MTQTIVQVAIPTPLHQTFDYLWQSPQAVVPGVRVTVPFGRRSVVGVVMATATDSQVPANKMRAISRVHDEQPVIPAKLFSMLQWASRYYHHPIGDVLTTALPVLLRRGNPTELAQIESFQINEAGLQHQPAKNASVQTAILDRLKLAGVGMPVAAETLATISTRWRSVIKPLVEQGLVARQLQDNVPENLSKQQGPELLEEQQTAVTAVSEAIGAFKPFLLHGVTGSGKTEVYLRLIDEVLERGEQVLIMVPEISLTPQLMQRFERRISGCLVSLHSGLNDTQRLQNWLLASQGKANVVVGTRSSIFTPLPRLGMIIIDEEHDSSLKQQDGFRYHARDLALIRARDEQCPIVLGTATPSFETLYNAQQERFSLLRLQRRAGDAKPPEMALLDIRRRPLIEGISDRLLMAVETALNEGGQALVFINRRGFSPTLLCNDCGACADCNRCDAHMTVHAKRARLRCHHCGSERAIPRVCESCGSDSLDNVGYGTERIAAAMQDAFPDATVARIDRDSTRRKGELEKQLEAATRGDAQILVGTQMLAKGHHFPGVTLVGILDADRGLFGTDFRALEQMGQLIVQVAGRSGREKRQGKVLIQTRNPDNEMMKLLVSEGYDAFAKSALEEREQAYWPPYSFVALLRAEATDSASPVRFLKQVRQLIDGYKLDGVVVLGPAPAPMERLGGRYRAQLLFQAGKRSGLNALLSMLNRSIPELEGAKRTRWSIDVDPVDLF